MPSCVFVVASDEDVPFGALANAVAVLALSVGKLFPEAVAPDVVDGTGRPHAGITTPGVSVLAATAEQLNAIRVKAVSELTGVAVLDVPREASLITDPTLYRAALRHWPEHALSYVGLALYGDDMVVRRLTASLPSMR